MGFYQIELPSLGFIQYIVQYSRFINDGNLKKNEKIIAHGTRIQEKTIDRKMWSSTTNLAVDICLKIWCKELLTNWRYKPILTFLSNPCYPPFNVAKK